MTLIDKDALESLFAGPFVTSYKDCREALRDAPEVDAVPLEPLCRLLSQIAGAPCRSIEGDNKCTITLGNCNPMQGNVKCWENFIRACLKGSEDNCE